MAFVRTSISEFSLANVIYAGAEVTFYVANEDGTSSGTLATLYAEVTGSETLSNPQRLDSEGRFVRPVYIEEAVVATIVRPGYTVGHTTGVIQNQFADDAADAAEAAKNATIAHAEIARRAAAKATAKAKEASDASGGINLPDATGQGNNYIRQKADVSGFEYRTPAEVYGDIGLPAITASEAGQLMHVSASGSWELTGALLSLDSSAGKARLTFEDDDGTHGPIFDLFRDSDSPALNDLLGKITWTGKNADGDEIVYGYVDVIIDDATAGTEDGRIRFIVRRAGSEGLRGYIGSGLVMGAPTGTDKGAGTINVENGYYLNGDPLVTKPFLTFRPAEYEPPSTNYATFDVRNGHPVLDFDDATAEAAIWTGLMPAAYNGGDLKVTVYAAATSATSGTQGWTVELERIGNNNQDLDADGFAPAQTITAWTVSTTAGAQRSGSVTITAGDDTDNIQAGDTFRIRIKRDVANDDAAGDAELVAVTVEEV